MCRAIFWDRWDFFFQAPRPLLLMLLSLFSSFFSFGKILLSPLLYTSLLMACYGEYALHPFRLWPRVISMTMVAFVPCRLAVILTESGAFLLKNRRLKLFEYCLMMRSAILLRRFLRSCQCHAIVLVSFGLYSSLPVFFGQRLFHSQRDGSLSCVHKGNISFAFGEFVAYNKQLHWGSFLLFLR